MKWTRWYIIIMVALVVLYMIAEYNRPKVIDWRPTYSNRDKIPYGTYIVYNEMKAFFDGRKPKEMREPFYNHVNNSEETGGIYFFINGWFDCTNEDVDELYNFISAGNTVFIAAERYADTFINKFKVDAEWYLDSASGMSDSTSINFASPALRTRRGHVLEKNTLEGYFSRIDTANTAVLGNNNHGKPNFIKTTIGDGMLYLHAVPRAFTNIFILKNDNASYINKVFSHLPKNPSAIYWDEFAKQGRGGPDTPLRVILTRPELKWAYYLALAGMLIFVLFEIKRRQRIIPIIVPPRNDSKEFVETVSRVYLNQKHHLNIADKKIAFWLDFVRQRVGVPTRDLNEEFIEQVSHRTAVSKEEIQKILHMIAMVRVRPAITGEELLKISQLIDNFYKQAK